METITPTAVQAGAGKAANVFWDWGIPLVALGVGYVMGDFVGLGNIVRNTLKDKAPKIGNTDTIGLIVAGIFVTIGVMLWRGLGGMIGKIAGFFFIGVSIGVLKDALAITP